MKALACPHCLRVITPELWLKMHHLGWVGCARSGGALVSIELRRCPDCEQPVGVERQLPLAVPVEGA